MSDDSRYSPERVVEAAFEAFRRRDGHALAALASPSSLQEYVSQVRSDLRPQWHVWTVDDLRKHDPDMPVEAAQWQVEQMEQRRASHESVLLRGFEGVSAVGDLERMSAAELISSALRAAPEQAVALGWCRVLGHVKDGDDRAFVLFWLAPEGEPPVFDEPNIAVVDRVAGNWRLRLESYPRWGVPGFRNVGFIDQVFNTTRQHRRQQNRGLTVR